MSEDKTLQECLKHLIEKVITITSDSLHEYVPEYVGKKYEKHFSSYAGHIRNPHLCTDKPLPQRLFEDCLRDFKDQIEALDEFKTLADKITASNALNSKNKFNKFWGIEFEDNFDLFFSTIWKVVKSSYEKGSFDQVLFTKEYENLKAFFDNENVTLSHILVPIYNLKCDRDLIDFSQIIDTLGKVVLRSITSEDKTFLISTIGGYSNVNVIPIHMSDFILDIEYYDKFYSQEKSQEKIKEQIEELISALRLLKEGYIGASLILFRPPLSDKATTLMPIAYDLYSLTPPVNLALGQMDDITFYLSECEVNTVHHILQLLKQIIEKKKDLPIRRFNSSYEKPNKADKFLDLMITYETLFSGKRTDSVTHKLAWRFSRLLGNDSEQCSALYDDMKKLYERRSTLVHGDNDDVDSTSVQQLQDYMRRSIKEYLKEMDRKSFKTNNQFTHYLDFEKNFGKP